MTECSCGKKAVISLMCKDCFIESFEKRVVDTIARFELVKKDQKVLVATSGGKDSLTVLYILNKYGYNVEALCVDEGIAGYRDSTISDMQEFADKYNIKLKIVSFKKDFEVTLDYAVEKLKEIPCSICGVFRRYVLNKYAKEYDVIVTGHNLDDEVQSIVMNYIQNKIELLARLGPKSGLKAQKGFTQRVKPLYFCSEKEIRAYTLLMKFKVKYTECPYAYKSFRYFISEKMNEMEFTDPGTKLKIVNNFLGRLSNLKQKFIDTNKRKEENRIDSASVRRCISCGEPSRNELCATCIILKRVGVIKK